MTVASRFVDDAPAGLRFVKPTARESIFDDPTHGATLETLVRDAVNRVLEDIGPAPFAGAVFDKTKHRWVKPADAGGGDKPTGAAAAGAKGDAPQLDDAEKASIGAGIDKDLDKLPEDQRPPATLVAKAKAVAVAAATKVYEWAWRIGESKLGGAIANGIDAYFDSPMDMKKLGYNPNNSSGTANPKNTDNVSANIKDVTGQALGGLSDAVGMDLAQGISGHLVAKIAATVLSHLVVKIKRKLTGKPATEADQGDGITEWADMIAQLFSHLNGEMGVEGGAPDAATVETNLRELLKGKAS